MATISAASSSSGGPVAALLAARILEDCDLIVEMLALIPPGREEWRPEGWPDGGTGELPFTVALLRAHLAESAAGVCACLYRLHPEDLPHVAALHQQGAAAAGFEALRVAMAEGFALVADAELTQSLPTVFAPQGAAFLETLLINWKHLLHHAHQLFLYLKLLEVPVSTRHLYRFR